MTPEALTSHLWASRTAMLRLAMSMLRHPQNAEDAVSAAMVKAYEKAHRLRSDEAVKPWLMTITANACRDQLRRNKRITLLPNAGEDAAVLFDFDPEDAVYPHILALPADTAETLLLYYYENFDTREIARVLRIPSATVRARLSRGRRMLKDRLERSRNDETSG